MSLPKQIRFIKVLKSPVKVKVEPPDEEDLNIECRLCSKAFANEVAVRNHLRMEHSGEEVDLDTWVTDAMMKKPGTVPTTPPQKKLKAELKSEAGRRVIARRTAALVQSMQPTDIMSLASQDVSYIIIKAEDGKLNLEETNKNRRQKRSSEDEDSPRRKNKREREREVVPISGPFECLQPSTVGPDGACHQIFFSCCDYSIHFRDEHTRRRKAVKCQVCEKVLASSIGEEATSPYPCHVCGSGFQNNADLTTHMNTVHVKLKPFECAICHKRFTQQGGVLQHMRMHTGDRPFPCSYCQKSFTQKSGLDQHLRTHTKVKPYRCVICGKTFIQSVHLKQHMRTHTNVSPFQCVICEKRFKQSSHLNYHLKHHNEANMTEDQKTKYQELIGMINSQQLLVEAGSADDEEELRQAQQVIVEEGAELLQYEAEEVEYVEEENIKEDMSEQIVVEDNREYTLTDNGDAGWSARPAP
ncbi:hypothetical protein JYU34_008269 [Plutella xylostella]|uniref:C2H2-type domain-containing protein n=1 Tax=Plutella xylostella TaxID=51655 RepID=A0ABQ7QP40_PLUXY|nr:hypothetical protein JYU34_008269 [Plutella xylostella]